MTTDPEPALAAVTGAGAQGAWKKLRHLELLTQLLTVTESELLGVPPVYFSVTWQVW